MSFDKTRALRAYAVFMLVFISLWWPLSHWLYPDWYHDLLGFGPLDGPILDAMVKIIGTMGLFPVAILAAVIKTPNQARVLLQVFLLWSVGMAATYVYLINQGVFPVGEYLNVALLAGNFVVMVVLMPRAQNA